MQRISIIFVLTLLVCIWHAVDCGRIIRETDSNVKGVQETVGEVAKAVQEFLSEKSMKENVEKMTKMAQDFAAKVQSNVESASKSFSGN